MRYARGTDGPKGSWTADRWLRRSLAASPTLCVLGALAPALGAAPPAGPANWDRTDRFRSRDALVHPTARGFRWTDQGVDTVINGVVVTGAAAHFGTLEGDVGAVSARTGRLQWKVRPPYDAFGPPVIHRGVLYVGMGNDTVALESPRRWIRGTGPSG